MGRETGYAGVSPGFAGFAPPAPVYRSFSLAAFQA